MASSKLLIPVSALIIAGLFFYFNPEKTITIRSNPAEPVEEPTPTVSSNTATLIFVGDIMLSRSVGLAMEKSSNYNLPFEKITPFLQTADIVFGNLEGPISSRGKKVGSIYSFRDDPRVVQGLKYADFNILSIANNHIWDYSKDAFLDTLTSLKNAKINYVGGGNDFSEAHEPVILNAKGQRIAFLAYTDLLPKSLSAGAESPGISYLDEEQMIEDIGKAKSISDLIIVSFHWGDEYQTQHNQKQELIAQKAINAGTDLVVGHHPHVVQEVVQYKNGWIVYSLGNFVFDQMFSAATKHGLILEVKIQNSKIIDVEQKNIVINNNFQPELEN